MLAVVLADTHLRAASKQGLPEQAKAHLGRADLILHAGDVVERALLDELADYAPVEAVLGNNDTGMVLPETRVVDCEGVCVAMIHDSGPRVGRAARMHRRFPTADVVVFGHSHIPWNEPGVHGQLLFNPGSATQRRSQPQRTIGLLEFRGGRVRRHEIVAVG